MKQFFSNVKNRILTILATIVAIGLVVWVAGFASARVAEGKSIGAKNAYRYALEDAGIDNNQVTRYKSEFDKEDGKYIFEVEFEHEGKEYEYKISASDGSVIARSIEVEREEKPRKELAESDKAAISLEEAKAIALRDAGFAENDVEFKEAKLDDDERSHYEIEFKLKGKEVEYEYEYEISLKDGSIIDRDVDSRKIDDTKKLEKPAIETSTANVTEKDQTVKDDDSKEDETDKKTLATSKPLASKVKSGNNDDDDDKKASSYKKPTKDTGKKTVNTTTKKPLVNTEKKSDDDDGEKNTSKKEVVSRPKYISVDKAKEIATRRAGTSPSKVRFTNIELDSDDGKMIYEIEFYQGNFEYDVEIDARSGAIIEFEREEEDD